MRIRWKRRAQEDLDAIREFIGRDSRRYASRFAANLVRSLQSLRRFPELGEMVPQLRDHDIRERLFGNYRILDKIEKGTPQILTIVHAARDLKKAYTPEEE